MLLHDVRVFLGKDKRSETVKFYTTGYKAF